MNSLPLAADEELKFHAQTWLEALGTVPDPWLVAAWEKARDDYGWDKPFPVAKIPQAYKALIVDDRARIERERYLNNYNSPETYACRWCSDTGYPRIAIWCRSYSDWRVGVMACECEMAPISQRRPSPILRTWERDEMGIWRPSGVNDSLPCTCLFCKYHKGGNSNVRQSTRDATDHQDRATGQSPGHHNADSNEYYGSSRDENWEEFDI